MRRTRTVAARRMPPAGPCPSTLPRASTGGSARAIPVRTRMSEDIGASGKRLSGVDDTLGLSGGSWACSLGLVRAEAEGRPPGHHPPRGAVKAAVLSPGARPVYHPLHNPRRSSRLDDDMARSIRLLLGAQQTLTRRPIDGTEHVRSVSGYRSPLVPPAKPGS